MIDVIYNYRQSNLHYTEFSKEFNKLCMPFEKSLTKTQLITFRKFLDM